MIKPLRVTLKAHSDGWRLRASAYPDADVSARLVLEGLMVTREEALAILPGRLWWQGDWRGPGPRWPLDAELTWDEGMAIWRRDLDPLGALLPKYRARALTSEELLG